MIKINRQPLSQSGSGGNPSEPLRSMRKFYELLPGECFKALITDIKPGLVTIRLDSGDIFTARTMVLPDARIGEESLFTVRENNQKGQILLEMVSTGTNDRQSVIIREALGHAGLFASEDNIALGKALLDNGLPVDAATLQRAAFFRYAGEGMTPEAAAFLVHEGIPADMDTARLYAGLLTDPHYLRKAIDTFMATFLADPTDETLAREHKKQLQKQLFLPLKEPLADTAPQEQAVAPVNPLHRYYNGLRSFVAQHEQWLDERGFKSDIPDMLQCMAHINRYREYYQIPFVAEPDGPPQQAELYVFKDGKGKTELARQANVLIALDTAALGRVEVYTQKNGRTLSLQFRCDSDEALRTIKAASQPFTRTLREKGFSMAALGFAKTDHAFTLTDEAPGEDEPKQQAAPKRYLFDMRI